MKRDMDQILQQALSPEREPDCRLNQRILQRSEEAERMRKQNKKRIPAAACVACATLLLGSIGVFAAWKYLTPSEVAQEFHDEGLSAAFQGEDAIMVNETQEYGGYRITLLGIVSGKNLSQYAMWDEDGNIKEDRSYVVTAIENSDGTPRPMVSDDAYGEEQFCVSPLIGGLNPWEYNVITMGGGYTEYIIDGIQYRLTECDNIEIFADRGLYLSVNDGTFFENGAYHMDPDTGDITRNEAYSGVNALFRLPIDKNKADPAAAEAYIREMESESAGEPDASEDAGADEENPYAERRAVIAGWTAEDFEEKAELLETQILTPEDGYISYDFEHGTDAYSGVLLESLMFEEGQTGFSDYRCILEETQEYTDMATFTKNADGTITLRVYRCPESQTILMSPAS